LGIGFEFAAQDLNFTENAVVGPNETIQGADYDYVGGTDVGAASVGGALGGFSFSITGEDFNFLFKALQSDGMVEVLSRPTILVENNEEANITIGNQVPIVQGVATSTAGQLSSQVTYENVGIILDVVPHINPDGFVNLEVKPEISSLSPSSVQISEGFTAPIISERSAETVVTVKDGETVVIGGLIDTSEQQSETKVPILGDVPGVGALFRATNMESRRTELLIVLTVNVVRSEDDAYALSLKMRDGSGIITPKIKRSPLMEGLRILPEEEEGLGPVDIEAMPIAPERDEAEPDRQLYGPNPDVYGPQVPQRVQISRAPTEETKQVYGPALVSHPSP
ncbi:MAG: type II and III secretion system protein, partial [Phycisphaerales bacterium]